MLITIHTYIFTDRLTAYASNPEAFQENQFNKVMYDLIIIERFHFHFHDVLILYEYFLFI